jgi:FixJ family two-component response regulator
MEAEAKERQHRSVKERRELLAEALRRDSGRSNRAIAAECGVSDKTVGAVRAEIGAEIRNDAAEIRTKEKQLRLITAE